MEEEHFAWAIQGVEAAFQFVPPEHRAYLREQVLAGFDDFARCHTEFFQRALDGELTPRGQDAVTARGG